MSYESRCFGRRAGMNCEDKQLPSVDEAEMKLSVQG